MIVLGLWQNQTEAHFPRAEEKICPVGHLNRSFGSQVHSSDPIGADKQKNERTKMEQLPVYTFQAFGLNFHNTRGMLRIEIPALLHLVTWGGNLLVPSDCLILVRFCTLVLSRWPIQL